MKWRDPNQPATSGDHTTNGGDGEVESDSSPTWTISTGDMLLIFVVLFVGGLVVFLSFVAYRQYNSRRDTNYSLAAVEEESWEIQEDHHTRKNEGGEAEEETGEINDEETKN